MWQRLFLYLIAIPVLIYAGIVAVLYVEQRQYVFRPDTNPTDAAAVGIAGLRTIVLNTSDGLALRSWYLPPPSDAAPVIVLLHGNGGNIATETDHLRRLAGAGMGVLALEYRGYGGNPGTPTEAGLFHDIAAARAFLTEHGIKPERTVLYGISLGTGVAIASAVTDPCAAVILEAPYASITALAEERYPFVPVALLLSDRFDSLARIGEMHVPVMILQGSLDGVVPPAQGQALYAAANQPKDIRVYPDAGHVDLPRHGAVEAAIDFMRAHVPSS